MGNTSNYIEIELHQIKSCTADEAINRAKKQCTARENLLANYVSDKRLKSNIYEELNSKKSQ